jgi:hypothetical protein
MRGMPRLVSTFGYTGELLLASALLRMASGKFSIRSQQFSHEITPLDNGSHGAPPNAN